MRIDGKNLYVSRKDLLTLLAKLDGYPKDSSCALIMGDAVNMYSLTDAEADALPQLIAEEHHLDDDILMIHPETADRIEYLRDLMSKESASE